MILEVSSNLNDSVILWKEKTLSTHRSPGASHHCAISSRGKAQFHAQHKDRVKFVLYVKRNITPELQAARKAGANYQPCRDRGMNLAK